MLKAPATIKGISSGIADIGLAHIEYTRGRFPVMEACEMPLGYASGWVANQIMNDFYNKFKPKEFDKVMEERKDFNNELTSGRLIIQERISDDEWEEIMDLVLDVKPKKQKRQEKSEIKSKLQLDKSVVAFRKEILEAFADESDVAAASECLDQFEARGLPLPSKRSAPLGWSRG